MRHDPSTLTSRQHVGRRNRVRLDPKRPFVRVRPRGRALCRPDGPVSGARMERCRSLRTPASPSRAPGHRRARRQRPVADAPPRSSRPARAIPCRASAPGRSAMSVAQGDAKAASPPGAASGSVRPGRPPEAHPAPAKRDDRGRRRLTDRGRAGRAPSRRRRPDGEAERAQRKDEPGPAHGRSPRRVGERSTRERTVQRTDGREHRPFPPLATVRSSVRTSGSPTTPSHQDARASDRSERERRARRPAGAEPPRHREPGLVLGRRQLRADLQLGR